MTRITVNDLDPMHEALSAHFLDILKNGEEVINIDRETGERTVARCKPSAAMMNQIRQFLKDNNVIAAASSRRMQSILDNAPFTIEGEATLVAPLPTPENGEAPFPLLASEYPKETQ